MNLDELRSVQNRERQKDSLQHLRESFYEDVADYVENLKRDRDRAAEAAEDPFASPEVRRLTDEIETAREVTRAIYERRLGKLVKRASLAAADMPADEEGLTAEERELFADLVDRIERNKSHVLDVVEGETDEGSGPGSKPGSGQSTGVSESLQTDPESSVGSGRATDGTADQPPARNDVRAEEGASVTDGPTTADEVAPADDPPDPGSDSGADGQDAAGVSGDGSAMAALDDRTTVRITRDVGEIVGVDRREYDLSPETVVTLPAENADPLLERGAAERIE